MCLVYAKKLKHSSKRLFFKEFAPTYAKGFFHLPVADYLMVEALHRIILKEPNGGVYLKSANDKEFYEAGIHAYKTLSHVHLQHLIFPLKMYGAYDYYEDAHQVVGPAWSLARTPLRYISEDRELQREYKFLVMQLVWLDPIQPDIESGYYTKRWTLIMLPGEADIKAFQQHVLPLSNHFMFWAILIEFDRRERRWKPVKIYRGNKKELIKILKEVNNVDSNK